MQIRASAYARRTYDKRFEELYSNDVNPESLYKAQVSIFARFAKIHPRVAFLLEQLRQIYENLDTSLDMFKLNYGIASPENSWSQQTVRFKGLDPFCLLQFRRSGLRTSILPFTPTFRAGQME